MLLAVAASHASHVEIKPLPASLNKHGLVVVQLGPGAWRDARVTLSPGGSSVAHDGFFVEALKPGEYTLDSVTRVVNEVRRHGVAERDYAHQPIGREFRVEAGKITHLGLLYMVHEPQGPQGEVRSIILPFSNPGPERIYLEKYYPKLAANVSAADVLVPEFDYVNDKLSLSRDYLYRLWADEATRPLQIGTDAQDAVVFLESGWAFGDLGLVVRPGPRPGEIRIFGNETVNRLNHIGELADVQWFSDETTGALYRTRGEDLVIPDSMPEDFFVAGGVAINETSMVLVDRRLRLLISTDHGKSWSRKNDHGVGRYKPLDVTVQSARDNVYIFGREHGTLMNRTHAVVIDRGTAGVRPLDFTARNLRYMSALFETDAGVFIQTEAGVAPTALYFRASGTREWIRNEIRTFRNCSVSGQPPTGHLEALCKSGSVRLISDDNGQSWQPVAQARD